MAEIILSSDVEKISENDGKLDDVASYLQIKIEDILKYNFGAIKNLEWEIKFETIKR